MWRPQPARSCVPLLRSFAFTNALINKLDGEQEDPSVRVCVHLFGVRVYLYKRHVVVSVVVFASLLFYVNVWTTKPSTQSLGLELCHRSPGAP